MHEFKIMFNGVEVFKTLKQTTVIKMLERGYLKRIEGNRLEFVENKDCYFYFSHKMPLGKVLTYLSHVSNQNATCEDCGKEMSFHIRPVMKNGQIDFKGIVCVCKTCRSKKLEQEDILVPQFRQDFSHKAMNKRVREELKKKHKNQKVYSALVEDNELFSLKKQELKLYSLSKIVLPPLKSSNQPSKNTTQQRLAEAGLKGMYEELDLSDKEVRKKVRAFLRKEDGKCPCCGERATTSVLYTIEHIKPKSRGGENNLNNFIGMCETCNKDKGNRTIMEYLQVKHFNALPYRALVIAHKEKALIEKEYQQFKKKVAKIEAEKAAEILRNLRKDFQPV